MTRWPLHCSCSPICLFVFVKCLTHGYGKTDRGTEACCWSPHIHFFSVSFCSVAFHPQLAIHSGACLHPCWCRGTKLTSWSWSVSFCSTSNKCIHNKRRQTYILNHRKIHSFKSFQNILTLTKGFRSLCNLCYFMVLMCSRNKICSHISSRERDSLSMASYPDSMLGAH